MVNRDGRLLYTTAHNEFEHILKKKNCHGYGKPKGTISR